MAIKTTRIGGRQEQQPASYQVTPAGRGAGRQRGVSVKGHDCIACQDTQQVSTYEGGTTACPFCG